MDDEKYRELNKELGIENIKKGYELCKSEPVSFATALRVDEHDKIRKLFDEGKTNPEVSAETGMPLRTVQDHRTKYYLSQRKKSD